MNITNRERFIKKLLYQSCNRGCKETDLIIGNFAKENLDKMTDSELKTFDEILQLPDIDIYDWYMRKKNVPEKFSSSIMSKIMEFDPLK